MKTKAQIQKIINRLSFMDRTFILLEKGDGYLLQMSYWEPDIETGQYAIQKTRKWYVSPHMTETEIVETAWACAQRSMLHVAAEHFTYKGKRVYSPHFDIDVRLEMTDRRADRRPNAPLRSNNRNSKAKAELVKASGPKA